MEDPKINTQITGQMKITIRGPDGQVKHTEIQEVKIQDD